MLGISLPELLMTTLVILVLSSAGVWPQVLRGIRELRGDVAPEEPTSNAKDLELCYKMLGVSPSAPWEDIEKAYRRKAKLHHPDHGGDADTMKALNDAYSMLKRIKKVPR